MATVPTQRRRKRSEQASARSRLQPSSSIAGSTAPVSLASSFKSRKACRSILLVLVISSRRSVAAHFPSGWTMHSQHHQSRRPTCHESSKWMTATIRGGAGGKFSSITIPPSSSSTTSRRRDTNVLPLIRLLFFTYYASLGSLMPYLPVYYHHLGHGGQVIGLLGAVKPFTTFGVAPLWGLVADQLQQPWRILQVTFLTSLIGQLCVGLYPSFWFIFVSVFVTAIFNAPVKSLLDALVLESVDQSAYGRLRLWGQLGFGVGSWATGLALSRSQEYGVSRGKKNFSLLHHWPLLNRSVVYFVYGFWQKLTGYKLLFLAYAGLSLPTWICIQAFRRMNLAKEGGMSSAWGSNSATINANTQQSGNPKGNTNTLEGVRLLLQNADALLFFFLVLVVGISSGVIENFAYVRMREVGGTGKEMGLSRLVSSISGAPMFWFSGPLSERLGADSVLVLSLLSYVFRFILYAFMRNPYHGLPAEALRGVTFAAFWSTSTIYAHRVSPPGLHATMLMFLNAMYGGLGQSIGALLGGKLQHKYGTVQTFLISASCDFVLVCLVMFYLSIRKESSFRDPKPIVARVNST